MQSFFIFARRTADIAFKFSHKIAIAVKPAVKRNVNKPFVVFTKQIHRLLEPANVQIFNGGFTCFPLEKAAKILAVEIGFFRKLVQRYFILKIIFDIKNSLFNHKNPPKCVKIMHDNPIIHVII